MFCLQQSLYLQKENDYMNLIELNMDKIIALCKKYKVSKLFVFGSILTNRFNKESDVDFIVNFDKAQVTDYFSNFFDLKYALEDIWEEKLIYWKNTLFVIII